MIADALNYYDNNMEQNLDVIKRTKYVRLIYNKGDMEHNMIELYDEDKKKIGLYEYEIFGLYNPNTQIWIWGWSIPTLNKNSTYVVKKLLNYGINLDAEENILLKAELITSRFKITNPIQLDIHVALAAYLAKQSFIFKYNDYNKRREAEELIDIRESEYTADSFYISYYLTLSRK